MSAELQTPDAFDPALECGAWRKVPSVIGGPVHTHKCREAADHLDRPDYSTPRPPHTCGCGHTW